MTCATCSVSGCFRPPAAAHPGKEKLQSAMTAGPDLASPGDAAPQQYNPLGEKCVLGCYGFAIPRSIEIEPCTEFRGTAATKLPFSAELSDCFRLIRRRQADESAANKGTVSAIRDEATLSTHTDQAIPLRR